MSSQRFNLSVSSVRNIGREWKTQGQFLFSPEKYQKGREEKWSRTIYRLLQRRCSIILQQVVSLCTGRSLWESDARGATDPSRDAAASSCSRWCHCAPGEAYGRAMPEEPQTPPETLQHHPAAGGVTVHREKLMGERCQRSHRPLQRRCSIILQQVVSLCTGRSLWESDARGATDSSRDAAASSCSRWCHCAPGEAYGRAMPEKPQTPPETLQHHPAAGGVTVHREKLMGERCQRSHRPLQRPAASSCSRWCHCAPGEAYGRAMPEKPQTPPETLQHHPAAGGVTVHRERLMGERCQRSHRPLQRRCSIILQQVVSLCTGRGLWESDAREATDPTRDPQHHPAAGGVTVHREKLMAERCQRSHRPLQRPAASSCSRWCHCAPGEAYGRAMPEKPQTLQRPAASSCSRWCHCAPGEAYGRAMPEEPQTPPETRSIILQQVVSLCTGRSLWQSDAREATDPSRDAAASSCSRWCHCAPGEAYGRAMPEEPQTPPETLQHHPAAGGVTVHREKLMGERCQRSHRPLQRPAASSCSRWCHCAPGEAYGRAMPEKPQTPPETLQHHPAAGGVTVHREKLMGERCQRSHRPSRDAAASSCSRWCHCAPGEAYGRAMPEEPQTLQRRCSIILQQVVSLCTGRSLWESDARGATDPSRDPQHHPAAGGVTVHREKLMAERCQRSHRPLQRRCSIILQQVVSLCTGRSLWESDAREATDSSRDPQHHPAAGGVTVHREKLMGERCQRSHRPLQRPAASSCSRWCHCAPGEAYGRAMPEKPHTEAPEGCRRRSCALMRQRLSCLVIQKGVVHSGQKTQQENHLLPPIRFG
ncbi:uncharacterized protein [Engystomops pustulosus]|uniref:uncharacterized protein isoform X2 n=1 Tax=Engystomops pustulosus TaxID=76066 RepID=UPI003AFB657E